MSAPPVTLRLMLFASVGGALYPITNVRVPAPPLGALTTGVPDTVRPVITSTVRIPPALPVTVMLPVPNEILRVLVLLDVKLLQVSANDWSASVPCVWVKVLEIVRLAPSVRPRVALLRVTSVQIAPAAVVQVPVPERLSKVTVSAATGAEAPEAPPDVAAQLAVELASQVPVPPTQNLAAMLYRPSTTRVRHTTAPVASTQTVPFHQIGLPSGSSVVSR